MSLASNLAALGRVLTAAAGGIVKAIAPAAGDSSTALITSAWFKGEQAAEATQGTAMVATQAQTNAGTDDATIVTPKKLRAGFSISLGMNGYIAFPTWLGGLILQWSSVFTTSASGATVWTFPLAFPSGILMNVGSDNAGGAANSCSVGFASGGKTSVSVAARTSANVYAATSVSLFVLGY